MAWAKGLNANKQAWFEDFITDKRFESDEWLESIKDILDGDVAANLANRITNLEGTVTALDAKVQTNDNKVTSHLADYTSHTGYADDTGTANAKVIVLNPAPTVYKKGMSISFLNLVTNTGAVTVNANALGIKSLTNAKGCPLIAGSLKAGLIYSFRFNGTSFNQQGEGGKYGNATTADVLAGKTFGTENGVLTGLLKKGAVIKSVQRGNAGMSDGPIRITIASVDLSKSFVKVSSTGYPGYSPVLAFIKGVLENSTTIVFTRETYDASKYVSFSWEVVEFADGVSVQSGVFFTSVSNPSITVSPVDLMKSFIIFSFSSTGGVDSQPVVRLASATNIAISRPSPSSLYISWFLVEFL